MSVRITAKEARALLDGVHPLDLDWTATADLDGGVELVMAGHLTVARAYGVDRYEGTRVAELLAAAPDLAATVIAQAEEIARLKSLIAEHEPDRAKYRALSVDKGVEYANGWEDCAISIRVAAEVARDA